MKNYSESEHDDLLGKNPSGKRKKHQIPVMQQEQPDVVFVDVFILKDDCL